MEENTHKKKTYGKTVVIVTSPILSEEEQDKLWKKQGRALRRLLDKMEDEKAERKRNQIPGVEYCSECYRSLEEGEKLAKQEGKI